MRLIDANKVVKDIISERDKIPYELVSEKPFKHGNSMRGGIRKALRCIEQAQTVDAVPVVRCEYCNKGHPELGMNGCVWCVRYSRDMNTDDFCSYGERKEGAY